MPVRRLGALLAVLAAMAAIGVGVAAAAGGGSSTPQSTTPQTTQPRATPPPSGGGPCPHGHSGCGGGSTDASAG
jgi:hypothetical protein